VAEQSDCSRKLITVTRVPRVLEGILDSKSDRDVRRNNNQQALAVFLKRGVGRQSRGARRCMRLFLSGTPIDYSGRLKP
jgi:hypothetical protein